MVETERGRCDAKRNTHHPEGELFLAINHTIWRCGFIDKETHRDPDRFAKIIKVSEIFIKLILNPIFHDLKQINRKKIYKYLIFLITYK